MNPITTIDELDQIIEWSLANQSRIGYFAVLMTLAVKQSIIANEFQDGQRMQRLDMIVGSQYFAAWDAYVNQKKCSNAWHSAFDACQNSGLIVLQHLLLRINTHINLDLCIAAAECCPGKSIFGLQSDFEKINEIIAAQSQLVQDNLCNVWPPLKLLTNFSNNQEKSVLNFSIVTARKCSRANAIVLANVDKAPKDEHISQVDNMVVELDKQFIEPERWLEFLLKPVRIMEDPDVDKLIGLLKN